MASGEFIQFVDSDDFVDEAMTETLVQAQAADDSDLIVRWVCQNSIDVWSEGVHTCNNELRGVGPAQFLRNFDELGKRQLLRSGGNKLYRSSLIGAIGLSFESEMSYAEDSVFNLKYMKHCNRFTVLSVSHYYYIYGHSAESLTSTLSVRYLSMRAPEIIATRDLFDAHPELVHEGAER